MADYVLAVRLDPADKARLEALVADDRARVEALGLAARPSPAETVRGLLRREVKARGLLNAAPAALATPPPAPPPAASSPGQQDQVLSQLVRLGAKATGGLVDAAALVRASGLSTTDAHAALYALRDAGQVELRADTSPDLRQPADEPLRPRTQAGEVVGYVARIGGSKMTTPKASKPAARPKAKPGEPTDDEMRDAVKAHCAREGLGSQAALATLVGVSKQALGDWLHGRRAFPAAARPALAKALG